MAATGSVRGRQLEDGLAGLLPHRNQAPVMLDGGEPVRILRRRKGIGVLLFTQQISRIFFRHTVDPLIGLYGPVQADAVLLNHIAYRQSYSRSGKGKLWLLPVVGPLFPFRPPVL